MSTIIEAPKSKFVPHPEGTFLAVMADCWLETKPNPWKGTVNDAGRKDTRDEITEIIMAFLTEEPFEDGGTIKPSYTRYRATASVAENSNLRRFIKGWFPKLTDADFERFDADKLIGRGAYVTVVQKEGKKGLYSFASSAMQPPKGAQVPAIPSDFIRHKDKPKDAGPSAQAGPEVATNTDEDDLPF
jgi:hypothetical protein